MKKSSIAGPASITSPELQIIDNEALKYPAEPAPSSSASIEHKETYVNMMYPSTAASCSTEIPPGTIESPDDDDDVEMMKCRTKKASRGPFRLKQLNLMKSGSYKLKHASPPPTELTTSPTEDKLTLERQKSASGPSRLKKFFILSRADPSRKRQKDVSLKNLRHVLWHNVSLVVLWPAIGNAELLATEIRGQRRMLTSDDALELGMKTAETQTELIDGSSPSSTDQPMDFQVVDEQSSSLDNNNQLKLNINSTKDIKDLRCIDDDDASSGRRILFPPDSPETKL